ncbi:MAG: Gfo/Idh/MocA family oxidoreductase, partial [Propionibacteriaceae bacterium]|nr:Gfo/Idh/MocA family oxidoreductase [Propionibacteriaceae bacterium]
MFSIGLLGASGIAPAVMIKPASRRSDVEVAAVASRQKARAQAYAEKWGIPRSYGSYEELFADPAIDLVYVALPPSEHARWAIAALRAGKDVLCEKPFAMNAQQARAMSAVADSTGRRLIEAFHDRYHPLSLELDDIRASGRLGELVTLTAVFDAPIPFDPAQFRHDPALGGGALMDLGCYPVHWVRALLGEEPAVTRAAVELNDLGADLSFSASLAFPSGPTATVSSTMAGDVIRSPFEIVGTRGRVHVENMIFP